MEPVIYADPSSEAHNGGSGHPERPARLEACIAALASAWLKPVTDLPAATDEQLARVHTVAYLERLERFCRRGGGYLDGDTYAREESFDIARRAAGSCCRAVDEVFSSGRGGFCLVRPPGHHATASRAMGFCLLNNVAVGAAHAGASAPGRKVSIVDFDVHHGNGTQDIFWEEASVQYISMHQYPWYPGTGALDETGAGAGAGTTVNIPLPAGATDRIYLEAMDRIVVPALEDFGPDVIWASAGFDAHARDPLGSMLVSTPGFGAMALMLAGAAGELCGGRLLMTLEGGYDLQALASSLLATLEAMTDPTAPWDPASLPDQGEERAVREALERAVAFHRR